uniref:LAMA1 n=1 Tax=Soboliphyme baturini TaxID=241478 RepID=A0A183J1D4_9BILA
LNTDSIRSTLIFRINDFTLQHNTQGINCQDCKNFFYRPSGVSHYNPDACRHCDCEATGSVDGSCVKDDGEATQGLSPGDCYCKPGFGGHRCDRCALGYRNYPVCEPCPCSIAGSLNYATCEDSCQCKENVAGIFCDRCKPGFFNLDVDNPNGCTACFCFGIINECQQVNWGTEKIMDMSGWILTDADGKRSSSLLKSSFGLSLTANSRQMQDKSLAYWKAPSAYLGDLVSNLTFYRILSYGGYLHYFVYFAADAHGPLTPMADVVLKGNRMTIEHSLKMNFPERENISISVRFSEISDWFHRDTHIRVNKREFMTVLADVQLLMVRAVYHKHQMQSRCVF